MGCNMVKSSSPNVPSTSVIFLCLRTHTSPQTCHHSASSILTVQISCCIIAMFVCRKQQEEWSRRIPTIGLAYFLTKLPYYNLCTGMYGDFHCKMCNNNTFFSLLMQCFDRKAWFLLFCHPLKLYLILYSTGTVLFHCCIISLRIRLKCQNPLLSYVRERKYTVNVQCSVQYTLFNVGNVLLCVIYRLNFTISMYVRQISHITLYVALGIIHCVT
jgi:hypothetical protein